MQELPKSDNPTLLALMGGNKTSRLDSRPSSIRYRWLEPDPEHQALTNSCLRALSQHSTYAACPDAKQPSLS